MVGETPKGSGTPKYVHVDFDDPLYIHPSDNAVTSVITIKLTGNENFRVWRSAMTRGLKARNKLGFVDGTITREKNDDTKSSKWERVNAVVCNWLLGLISETIYASHVYSDNAKSILDELFETYNKAYGFVIFNIH